MKYPNKRNQGMVKGAPSGLVISLLVHAAAFMLAGLLVVFSVVKKKEVSFTPPPSVERPKMKLKKPKVKVKKTAKPASPTRIIAKINKAEMPDLQLPEMGGAGSGFGGIGDLGGFDVLPDFADLTVLGSSQSIGNDLEGVYYDLKFSRSGVYNSLSDEEWRYLFYKFFRNDWDPRIFSKFYRSPKKLYTTYLLLPPSISAMAPVAFGMDDSMASGGEWIVHYKGKLVHKEDITFRFWVSVDDSLAIRVDGKVVIAASFINREGINDRAPRMYQNLWKSTSADSGKYWVGHGLATVGDWITLKAGEAKDMEVVATDNPNANASFTVMVQVKGVEYPSAYHHGPLLPIFKTAELTHDQLDIIYRDLPTNQVDCVNGPIFRDY
jgi:hypothetical protein